MIQIEIKDKYGITLQNGDVVKVLDMTAETQDHGGVFGIEVTGYRLEYREIEINPQKEIDDNGMFFSPNPDYIDKEQLFELMCFGKTPTEEQIQEEVIQEFTDFFGKKVDLEYILNELNSFEIEGRTNPNKNT